MNDIKKRCVEYSKELFGANRKESLKTFITEGPFISKDEIENAINQLKQNKAPGTDNIHTEMLKALDQKAVEELSKLFSLIYDTGCIPKELCSSIFINIPKKAKTTECSDYRIISVMSHVIKLLMKIILERIKGKITMEIADTQTGFQKDKGTREGIFNLRMLIERCLEVNKDIFLCFIDYTKAFDSINHNKLIESLEKTEIDGKDLRIIANLYKNQFSSIKINGELTESFEVQKGVRQGCVLSPLLYNLYSEQIFKDLEKFNGIKIGGINYTNLRYADDTVLVGDSEPALQELINEINKRGQKLGLNINIQKTKCMRISRLERKRMPKLTINKQNIEQVKSFVYLGHLITDDGKCLQEIKIRIELARNTFAKMQSIISSRKLTIETRKRLIKCYVWSTMLYGAETWTLNKEAEKRIEAFEMWVFRRILKIPWTAKMKNEELLGVMDCKRSLLDSIKYRKTVYFGHVVKHQSSQKIFLEGKIEGRKGRGRPRKTWYKNIEDWTGMKFQDGSRIAQNRRSFKSIVVNLLEGEGT